MEKDRWYILSDGDVGRSGKINILFINMIVTFL